MNAIYARWTLLEDGIVAEGTRAYAAAKPPFFTPEQWAELGAKIVDTHNDLIRLVENHAEDLFNETAMLRIERGRLQS